MPKLPGVIPPPRETFWVGKETFWVGGETFWVGANFFIPLQYWARGPLFSLITINNFKHHTWAALKAARHGKI